ncbi:hypothetical protein F442_03231, partial [Phytophthora nicotianae P10297]
MMLKETLTLPSVRNFARKVASVIKRAEARGMDFTRFSTHSVRISGATALLNAGADKHAIKLLERWMSSAYDDYP